MPRSTVCMCVWVHSQLHVGMREVACMHAQRMHARSCNIVCDPCTCPCMAQCHVWPATALHLLLAAGALPKLWPQNARRLYAHRPLRPCLSPPASPSATGIPCCRLPLLTCSNRQPRQALPAPCAAFISPAPPPFRPPPQIIDTQVMTVLLDGSGMPFASGPFEMKLPEETKDPWALKSERAMVATRMRTQQQSGHGLW